MGCCLCKCLIKKLGGEWQDETSTYNNLSREAMDLVTKSFDGLDPSSIVDVHCHLLGMSRSESGCFLNKNMDNCCRCKSYAKKQIFLQAMGVDKFGGKFKDYDYVDRLVSLIHNFVPPNIQNKYKKLKNKNNNKIDSYQNSNIITPKAVLLGLDCVYSKQGVKEEEKTSIHTPNKYVELVTKNNPNIFFMGPSIHPYRKDCIELLKYYHSKGVKIIKWLPNSMGIDPMSPLCDKFYDGLVKYNLILLTHTGAEHSLDDADYTFQEYGNPLRLRNALNKGVKIIMAHMASEGEDVDIEDKINKNRTQKSFDLFIRLMEDKKYINQLYGDISAMTAFRRVDTLVKAIQRDDLHDRLIFGSDFPVPAANMVVWYSKLVDRNLITQKQCELLREIFKYNPLLADFVSKRILRYKDKNGKIYKFKDIIFQRIDLVTNNKDLIVGNNNETKQDIEDESTNSSKEYIDPQIDEEIVYKKDINTNTSHINEYTKEKSKTPQLSGDTTSDTTKLLKS